MTTHLSPHNHIAGVCSEECIAELNNERSKFFSIASHQLRAPLTTIKGYSSLILEGDFGPVDSGMKDTVERIYESAEVLVEVVSDLLDISRLEQDRMDYHFMTVDVKDIVQEIVGEYEHNARKGGIALSFTYDTAASYTTSADRAKIKKIITNLVDNAVKYTVKGSVDITLGRRDNFITLNVKDTGVGIDEKILPRLFEKFTRARNASEVNVVGTGLGLYLARELLAAHGGTIRAVSAGENLGSTFIVELPVKE